MPPHRRTAARSSGASRPAAPAARNSRTPLPGLPIPRSVRTSHTPSLTRWWNGYAGVVLFGGPYSVSSRCRTSSTALYRSSPAASCWNRPSAYSNGNGLCGARVPLLVHCLSCAVGSSQSMSGDRSRALSTSDLRG